MPSLGWASRILRTNGTVTISATVGVMPTATRAIQLTIAVLVAVLVVHYAVEAIAWRLISRAEARMFLRGELFDEHRADLQRIAYYQQKHLRKQR